MVAQGIVARRKAEAGSRSTSSAVSVDQRGEPGSFLESRIWIWLHRLQRCKLFLFRPRLAGLHFTSEAIFFGFSSTNSSTGGAEAVLVNRLAKWLPYESMFLGAWRRSRRSHYFWLLPTPKLCESTFLGALSVEPFPFTSFGKKRLQTAPEAAGEALPNRAFKVKIFGN